jgi:hypothetical protein
MNIKEIKQFLEEQQKTYPTEDHSALMYTPEGIDRQLSETPNILKGDVGDIKYFNIFFMKMNSPVSITMCRERINAETHESLDTVVISKEIEEPNEN